MNAVKFYDSSIDDRVIEQIIPNIETAPEGYVLISDEQIAEHKENMADVLEAWKNLTPTQKIVNRQVVDISQDAEYLQGIKDDAIGSIMEEQVAELAQFDLTWTRNVILGKKTAAQFTTARAAIMADYNTRISEVENG